MMKIIFLVCGLLVLSPCLVAGPRDQNGCAAPAYKVALTYSESSDSKAIAVSIKPRDVTVQNLLALACQLRADYRSEREISVNVFNNERAARYTTVPTMVAVENSKRSNPAAYLATYYRDQQKEIEVVTLVANADNPCGNDIQIDLKNKNVSFVSCK